jgi:predicted CopG family antitoxin
MSKTMTKTLTIRDEVYRKLVAIKGDDESFSQLFDRLVSQQSPSVILNSIRGKIEFTKHEKKNILAEIDSRREEHRF